MVSLQYIWFGKQDEAKLPTEPREHVVHALFCIYQTKKSNAVLPHQDGQVFHLIQKVLD